MVTFFKHSLLIVICSLSLIFSQSNYSMHFDYMSGYAESNESAQHIINDYWQNTNNGSVQPFTVEAWYKNQGVNSGANEGYDDGANIISSYRRSGGGDPYNNFNLAIRAGDSPENPGKAYTEHGTESTERVDDGEWHHIAATYEPNPDGSWNYRIYIDGELNDETFGPDEDNDHSMSTNTIRINNHSPFAGDHMLDCSYAGLAITNGMKYNANFFPQFPISVDENTILNLDFSLGEGSQLIDMSPNGNHFNLYGSYQWNTDIPIVQQPSPNHSLSFDGVDDNVDLANRPITGIVDAFTILTSFKTNRLNSNQQIIYEHCGNYKDVSLSLNSNYHNSENPNSDYTLGFHLAVSQGAGGDIYAPAESISENTWHKVAIVWDGAYVYMHVDSALVSTINYNIGGSFDMDAAPEDGYIGLGCSDALPFDGNLDEISFWDRALTNEELLLYMSEPPSGNEENLSSYYNFDEGEGTTLTDLSGNGNHGTINGATWSNDGAPNGVQVMEDTIATITLSEVDTYIFPGYIGDTALVAVNADLGDIDLYSSEMHFTGFQGVLGFEGIVTEGTPMGDADWNVIVNEQEEVLITGNYGSDAISGDVTLFYLQFSVGDSLAEDSIAIQLAHVELNEEEGVIETMDGSVSVIYSLVM